MKRSVPFPVGIEIRTEGTLRLASLGPYNDLYDWWLDDFMLDLVEERVRSVIDYRDKLFWASKRSLSHA